MFNTIVILFLGLILGRLLRDKMGNGKVKKINSLLTLSIVCILLFTMGVRIATDPNIIENFGRIGVVSIVIFICLLFSSLFVMKMVTNWIDR